MEKEKIKNPKVCISNWKSIGRPDLELGVNKDITFMQIDVDSDIYSQDYNVDPSKFNDPLIRIYGVNEQGNSFCILVEDFYPYFFVKFPEKLNESDLPELHTHLNKVIQNKKGIHDGIKKLELVKKVNLKFFHEKEETFLKITIKNSKYVTYLRDTFESSSDNDLLRFRDTKFENQTFESKISFPLRYMIDNDIVGMSWITLPAGKFNVRDSGIMVSNCQFEATISYKNIISHPPEGQYSKLAPIRVLSFDIECAAKGGHFPKAENDAVIQIANHCVEFGKNNNEPIVKSLFSYRLCAEIPGAEVHSFETESDMFRAWKEFIVKLDPDIIIGYNISNFDFTYLFDRAEKLKINDFGKMSRIKETVTKAKHLASNSAKAFNNREIISINMDGRCIIDMYLLIVKDHRLRSNTLNNVSFHFLKEQKEDVHHTMIYDLWQKDEITRRRLGLYCLKDAYLPWKLCEHLMTIYNYAEMCRVTCTPLGFILSRGQQIKVISQLYKKALVKNYIIPNERIKAAPTGDDDGIGFEGASVLEPVTAFYEVPIVTLDFASLYPSIMIAHNLCYTTLVKESDVKKFKPEDIFKSPLGFYFVKEHVRKGILPDILEDLLNARKRAKKELKEATEESVKAVLDGRQLALKISANSVYGFTGAQVGQLPCLEISATVTAVGRSMIEKTRDFVLEKFNQGKGYKYNSEVVYGDTDSVMIKFGVPSLEEAMVLGKEASDLISDQFKKPIKIEFEKVYYPYLLMKKKRYAGLIWTRTDKWDKIDAKGLESVRRDNCELVKEVLEKVINMLLLEKGGKEKSIEFCKGIISDLLSNRIDLSKLIITKSISKKMENDDEDSQNKENKNKKGKTYVGKQAHVELAEKMKKRDEGTAPSIGDRVQYVMISGAKGTKNFENSEDPRYVLEKDIPIDFNYYIENQLKKPLLRLFEHVDKQAEAKIFFGKHITYIPSIISKTNIFNKLITVKKTCFNCKSVVDSGALCKVCVSNIKELYVERRLEANFHERLYSDLWNQCQRCQGSYYQEVICQNYDCPIFFKRLKVRKDLKELDDKLLRFDEHAEW